MIEPGAGPRRVWIQTPLVDLSFLILSPLAGLAVIGAHYATGRTWAGVAVAYLVGFPHYLSTLTFYMGDENREHYRRRWMAFFAGPAVIRS